MRGASNFLRSIHKKEIAVAKHIKYKRKAMMEPLEPRLLLSADTLVGAGFAAAMYDGMTDMNDKIQDFVDTDDLFGTRVPGILKYDESPEVRDLLYLKSDLNQDGVIYLDEDDENQLYDIDNKSVNDGDWKVDLAEFLEDKVSEPIKDYLHDGLIYPVVLPVPITDLATLETNFEFFLDNLDFTQPYSSGDISTQVTLLVENPDVTINSDLLTIDLELNFTFSELLWVDLGEQAGELKIAFEAIPRVYVDTQFSLDYTLGFDRNTGEFFFVVDEADKLEITTSTQVDTLPQTTMDVGFLETLAAYSGANDDFSISMPISAAFHDPSDPDALGFDTLPNASHAVTDPGMITTNSSIADLTDPDNFTLKYDVIFSLEIGSNSQIEPVEVTVKAENTDGSNLETSTGGGLENANLQDLLDDIQYAVDTADPALADIVIVDQDGSGKITLSLPEGLDASSDLGFDNEIYNEGGVLTSNSLTTFDFSALSHDVSFLLSVNKAIPYLVILPRTDPAIEDLGFAPQEDAELNNLIADSPGPGSGQFTATSGVDNKELTITVTDNTGSTFTDTLIIYEADPDGIGSLTGWNTNGNLGDLVQDINDAIADSVDLSGLVSASIQDGTHIVLSPAGSVTSVEVTGTNATEFGFTSGQANYLSLTTDTDKAGTLSGTATFDVIIDLISDPDQTVTVTVPDGSTDYIADINTDLATTAIEAVADGNRIVLKVKAGQAENVAAFEVKVPKVTKGNTSIADLIEDLNRVFDDEGIPVTSADAGSNRIEFSTGGDSLEITRKLTLDADWRVTASELDVVDTADLITDAQSDPDASFLLNLGVKAKPGLYDTSSNPDPELWEYFEPEAVLKANFNPFVEGTTSVVDMEGLDRLSFLITDGDNTPLIMRLRNAVNDGNLFVISQDFAPEDGILTVDAVFDITVNVTTTSITLFFHDTDGTNDANGIAPGDSGHTPATAIPNASLTDLVSDLNNALVVAGLNTQIVAEIYSSTGNPDRIILKAVDGADVEDIVISAGAEELGFVEDQSSETAFDEMLDFNVVSAEEVSALIGQLQVWLDRLPETALLNSTDIVFAQAVLGNILDFGDLASDELLIDDKDDGLEVGTNDEGKLLDYDTEDNLRVKFITAQDLAYLLSDASSQLDLLTGEKPVRYDPETNKLTYDLGLAHDFIPVEVPVDFLYDLDPLSDIYSESMVTIEATGYFDASLGLEMGQDVAVIDEDTTLSSINVVNRDTIALTGAEDVRKIYGRLTDDATFTLTIVPDGGGDPYGAQVTVYKADPDGDGALNGTDDNLDEIDTAPSLISDINNALANAIDPDAPAPFVEGSTDVTVYTLSGDAAFDVSLNGAATVVTVTVSAGDTTGNLSLQELVDDINTAIGATSLSDKIEASVSGDLIRLEAVDDSALNFEIETTGVSPFGFGTDSTLTSADRTLDLSSDVEAILVDDRIYLVAKETVQNFVVSSASNNTAFTELGIRTITATTVSVMGASYADSSPGDVDFTIDINEDGPITVELRNTDFNSTVTDLVLDINEALVDAGKGDLIVATRYGSRVILSAVDATVEVFEVAGTGAPSLGFSGTDPGDNIAAVSLMAERTVGDNPDGPDNPAGIYGQLSGDAIFSVSINGDADVSVTVLANATNGTLDAEGRDSSDLLFDPDTAVANSSVDDLVVDINNALEDASLDTEIVAESFGGRIVFRAIDASVYRFAIAVTDGDPSETQLGLALDNNAEPVLTVKGTTDIPYFYGPTDDATFDISITKDSETTHYRVSIALEDTLTNQSVYRIVGDVNGSLGNAQELDVLGGTPTGAVVDLTQWINANKDGDRLVLEVVTNESGIPALDPLTTPGDGFSITADSANPAVTDLKLWDVTAFATSDDLPVATDLTFAANNWDLLVRTSDGAVASVTLDGCTDIGDVITAIEAAADVDVRINARGTALEIEDLTFPDPEEGVFQVDMVNLSPAALTLGIFGVDVDLVDVLEGVPADGLIEGDRLRTTQMGDRFFVKAITPGADILSAEVRLSTPDAIDASGLFGIVEVDLIGEDLQVLYLSEFGLGLSDTEVTLFELFTALGDTDGDGVPGGLSDLGTVVTLPTYDLITPYVESSPIESGFIIDDDLIITFTIDETEHEVVVNAADATVLGFTNQSATNVLTATNVPDALNFINLDITFALTIGDGSPDPETYIVKVHDPHFNLSILDLAADVQYALRYAINSEGETVDLTATGLNLVSAGDNGSRLLLDAVDNTDTLTVFSIGTTQDNININDLADDFNYALAAAGLGSMIDARVFGNQSSGRTIRLVAVDPEIEEFEITVFEYLETEAIIIDQTSNARFFTLEIDVEPDFSWASGSPFDAGDGQVAFYMNNIGDPFAVSPFIVAESVPVSSFQLTDDVEFQVSINGEKPVSITVLAENTNGTNTDAGSGGGTANGSLADLVDDVNFAISQNSKVAEKIEAADSGGKIIMKAVSPSVFNFEITADSGNELGLWESRESFDPGAPVITVTGPNLTDFDELGDLGYFPEVDFDLIIQAFEKGVEFIEEFADQEFLTQELPLIGMSLNDMFNLAGRFNTALELIKGTPSPSIQDLDQALRQAFGLPTNDPVEEAKYFDALGLTPSSPLAIDIITGSKFLQLALRLPVGYITDNLEIGFDLPDIGSLRGDTGLGASGYMDVKLGLGIDLENIGNFVLFDDPSLTSITGDFTAANGIDPLNFRTMVDTRGLRVKDGLIDIDLDIALAKAVPDPTGYIIIPSNIEDLFGTGAFVPEFDIPSLAALLPLHSFDGSEFFGDIDFNPNFNFTGVDFSNLSEIQTALTDAVDGAIDIAQDVLDLDFSDFDLFDNIFSMIDGFDDFLQTIQEVLDGDIFSNNLPFIGDQLAAGADFIEKIRKGSVDIFEEFVQETNDMTAELVRDFLFALLGPGGGAVATIPDNIPGLGVLVKYEVTDTDGDEKITDDLIAVSDVPPGAGSNYTESQIQDFITLTGDGSSSMQWDFRLGGLFEPNYDLEFDLGWPALNLEMDAELLVDIGWTLAMGLGISLEDGVFFNVGADDDLVVDLGVEIATGSTMTGRLAFLQLEVEAMEDDFDGDSEVDPTRFEAGFTVDLDEKGTGADGLLGFSDLFSKLDLGIGVTAGAEVNLDLVVKFNEDILPDTIAALLPSVSAGFLLDWNPADIPDLLADDVEFDLGSGLDLVAFDDVAIDMGSFIGDLLGPMVDKIQEITEPVQPIIDIMTARIPVLSDLAGRTITLVDIAGMTGYVEPALIYAISDLITFVNSIPAEPGKLEVVLGDFAIIDTQGIMGGNVIDNLTGSELADGNFDLSDDSSFNLADSLPDGFLDDVSGFLGALGSASGDADSKSTMNGLIDSGGAGGGFAFPILENPSQVFGLLLGKPATIVTYDLAPFGLDFTWSTSFMIWGPLWARITASAGLTVDFAFGYDTEGVARFIKGDMQNPLDLLAGFYVSDTDLPEGTGGTDVPELVLKGEVFAGAELSAAGLASAGVEGGVILTVNFDLYDPNRDGKVRIDEMVNTFLYEMRTGSPLLAPVSIFDVYGDVSAQLRAYIRALVFEFKFDITPPITLFEFEIPFEREPILATERSDSLLINVGPNAASRLNGNTADIGESINITYQGGNDWKVHSDQFNVSSGGAQLYTAGQKVVIYGGEGADNITVDLNGRSEIVEIEFYGDIGDDQLTVLNGHANVTAFGGLGNDTITIDTISGNNVLYGQDGADTITVTGGSNNVVFGDNGTLRVDRQTGLKQRVMGWLDEAGDGIDTITTGDGADVIFGGGDSDIIKSGSGNDLVIGDGGYFTYDESGNVPTNSPSVDLDEITIRMGSGGNDLIFGEEGMDALFGGPGNDILDGGDGQDQLVGGIGEDTLYGGSDADLIYGDKGRDTIFGFRDPGAATDKKDVADLGTDGADVIYGGDHMDYIRGNADADVIYGGTEDDIIFGDAGNDLIYGNAGSDIIFGGADSDIIDGAEGSDLVFGDDGVVAYVDFNTGGVYGVSDTPGSLVRITASDHKIIGDGATSLVDNAISDGFVADTDKQSPDLYITDVKSSDGNDVIAGGAGNDIVLGGGGDDWVGGDIPVFMTYSDSQTSVDNEPQLYIYNSDEDKDGKPVIDSTGAAATHIDLGSGQWLRLATGLPLENPPGEDVLIGDGGQIEFIGRRFSRIISLAETPIPTVSYVDHLLGDNGEDIAFGGLEDDFIYGGHRPGLGTVPQSLDDEGSLIFDTDGDRVYDDDDILLGDNGIVEFHLNPNLVERIYTTDILETTGGADTIDGEEGDDIILGGVQGSPDILMGNVGHDVILGDNGLVDFAYAGDTDLSTLDLIKTNPYAITDWTTNPPIVDDTIILGGADIISGNAGRDMVMGGTGGDQIYGDDVNAGAGNKDYQDILLGDNGTIIFGGNVDGQLTVLGSAVALIHTTDVENATGGADTIEGNAAGDVIIGGVNGSVITQTDKLYGDAQSPDIYDWDDVILGDNGVLDFALGDTDLTTLDIVATRPYKVDEASILDEFSTDGETYTIDESTIVGGDDIIHGNTGRDTAFGGVGDDDIYGDAATPGTTDDADMLLGDNGQILMDGEETAKLYVMSSAVRFIGTTDTEEATGGADTIEGNANKDILFGGVNNGGIDKLYGDRVNPTEPSKSADNDDVILGDNGELNFAYDGDAVLTTLDLIRAYPDGLGGEDLISGNAGSDVGIGGNDGDKIYGDDNTASALGLDFGDILIGDNVDIFLVGITGQRIVLDTAVDYIVTTDDTESTGGADLIEGNASGDIIVGGVNNGGEDDLYGDAANVKPAEFLDGNDIILGDNAELDWTDTDSDNRYTLDLIATITYASDGTTVLGGRDNIFGNAGDDVVLGGSSGDLIIGDNDESVEVKTPGAADMVEPDAGADILIGDQGQLVYRDNFLELIETTDLLEADGGVDYIEGNDLGDILMGGTYGDILIGESQYGNDAGQGANYVGTPGPDIIIGDEGRMFYNADEDVEVSTDFGDAQALGDGDPATLDLIETFKTGDASNEPDALGGADWIFGNEGADIAMGGTDGDRIYGDFYAALNLNTSWGFDNPDTDIVPASALDPGEDILIGDGGQVTYNQTYNTLIRSIEQGNGGFDRIQGNDLADTIIGGYDGDWLWGEAPYDDLSLVQEPGGNDWILGDNGRLDYVLESDVVNGRPDVSDTKPSNDIEDTYNRVVELDIAPGTLDRVTTTDPTFGGDDVIRGNAAHDVIFGGTGEDRIWGDTHDDYPDGPDGDDGKDIVFGDHGKIYPNIQDTTEYSYLNNNFFAIDTQDTDDGDDDVIFGNGEDDTLLGQQGDDVIFGGTEYDILIGGHNVLDGHDDMDDMDDDLIDAITSGVLSDKNPADINDINDVMDGGSEEDILAGDNAIVIRQINSISPRFQYLTDPELYSMIDQELGSLISVNVGFKPNVADVPQAKPDSTVGYTVTLLNHSANIESEAAGAPTVSRWFGNDVMAGGSEDDTMFGQLGDDIMQGDGSIKITNDTTGYQMPDNVLNYETPFDPSPAIDPSFVIPDDQSIPIYFKVVDALYNKDLLPANLEMLLFLIDEDNADGDDYMEGNGGNDRMYGNLGQDDMIGGSSILFGLDDSTAEFRCRQSRPVGTKCLRGRL